MVSFFASLPASDWLASNSLAFAVADGFPVSAGHALVLTKRVVPTWFEATRDERMAVMDLVEEVKALLEERLNPVPDGWNVGFNAGTAAGQTIAHLHVHVIPRWHGDVPDPRGGVRHVIPSKANYLAGSVDDADLCIGPPHDPFLQRLLPELPGALAVDILAAFVQPSGVDLIEDALLHELSQGAALRILVGDYLAISHPSALRRLLAWSELADPDWPPSARCAVAVIELTRLAQHPSSFHPKSWRIQHADHTTVWVGSSNLSHAALLGGIEWNLRATSTRQPAAVQAVETAFNDLWQQATPLQAQWIDSYAQRPRPQIVRQAKGDPLAADTEPSLPVLQPRSWQETALQRLQTLRSEGFRRALAAVATGMGKTVLAALDVCQVRADRGKPMRVIVIAHRAELLAQTARTLRQAMGHSSDAETWCLGARSDLVGSVVLASVQKLARPKMLKMLGAHHFDYAIVDEVHHSEAPTWRRVLHHLQADFTLGLTATPERADGRDVASIFDDVIACEADIAAGIVEGSLVPFAYHGLADATDFTTINWRNGRFDEAQLEAALSTSARMERLWTVWNELPGRRNLVFCCSRRHARFACDWLRQRGVAAAAVFSGEGSDDRATALRDLAQGQLQAVCAVDLFNEGVDVPLVDRVVMLRPTESSVVFTQQLGRGLRSAAGKERLTVIDFVGNHRVFTWRLRHLLALAGADADPASLRRWLNDEALTLAPGCTMDVEVVARDMLRKLLPGGGGAVQEAYRELRDAWGRRPQWAELSHRGLLPSTLKARHDSWFDFLKYEGDLSAEEQQVLRQHHEWLCFVESTSLNKSWKMVVLRMLLDADTLSGTSDLLAHAQQARAYMLAHPILRADLQPNKTIPDHQQAALHHWASWWATWPLNHLDDWIRVEGQRIISRLQVDDAQRSTLLAMTAEVVNGRLADYVTRRQLLQPAGSFTAKVSHSGGKPILFLPSGKNAPTRPQGVITVQLPDGALWQFRMVKVACNVAHPVGMCDNQLPQLLRDWFGERAGISGTHFQVRFDQQENGQWTVQPINPTAAAIPKPVYAAQNFPPHMQDAPPVAAPADAGWVQVIDLAAAASGFSEAQDPQAVGWVAVGRLPSGSHCFVAQVQGQSMQPTIGDGAWCLFRQPVSGSRDNRVVLVNHHAIHDPEHGGSYTVKRYRSEKIIDSEGWHHATITLHPDNPAFSPIAIQPHEAEDLLVIAEFVREL